MTRPRIVLADEPDFPLGPLAVRPALREVEHGQTRETLEPRIMQVLVALASAAGAVVTRDDLIEACWDGRIVGEDAVQRCIGRIRRLAETSGAFVVETIPRIGYRLAVDADARRYRPLVAVLPFDNRSDDASLGFFSDGVSGEILRRLAQSPAIDVVGRTSAFQYRGEHKTTARVAADLKATHILDGAVQRAADRVRITAELIDVADGRTLWAERFDRTLGDLLALQDEIAEAAALALDARLRRSEATPEAPIEAYERYLKARALIEDLSIDTAASAATLLTETVALAPDFAPAHGLLAIAHATRRMGVADRDEARAAGAAARLAADRALALNPRSGAAWRARYLLRPVAGEYAAAIADLEAALAAIPNDVDVLWALAVAYRSVGRMRAAMRASEAAWRRDPLRGDVAVAYANLLYTEYRAAEAIGLLRGAVARWPSNPVVFTTAILMAAAAGDWDFVAQLEPLAGRFQGADRDYVEATERTIAAAKAPPEIARPAALARLDHELATTGALRVSSITAAARVGVDLDALYARVAASSVDHYFDPEARTPVTDAPHLLFLRINAPLRRHRGFIDLCVRLGLADYWLGADLWPDCADEPELTHDFRAAVRAARR